MSRLLKLALCLSTAALAGAQTTTRVDYGTQLRGVPLYTDATPVTNTLQQFCTTAGVGVLGITKNWTTLTTQTIPCNIQGSGGILRTSAPIGSVQQVVTVACPPAVSYPMFDTTLGGPGSIAFSKGCSGPIDPRMFVATGGDWSTALKAISGACAPIGGCQVAYPAGTFNHATPFTLTAGVPLQISGQGGGIYTGPSLSAPTLINYTGPGAWLNQSAGDNTGNVVLHDFGFTCSTPGCYPLQIGSFSEDDIGSYYRLGWSFYNLYFFGPSGSAAASAPGFSASHLLRFQMANMSIDNFYQPAVFDRTNAGQLNSVFFHNYTVGPSVTWKAGSGSGTGNGSQLICTGCEFQGPNYGSGNYSVTWDQEVILCISCLYEPTVTSAAYMHNTNQGHNFSDFFGIMSGTLPTNTFVFDSPAAISFFGTNCTTTPCSTISSGVPAAVPYGSPVTMAGVNAPLYQACLAVGIAKCQSAGSTPVSYGGYLAMTGPIRADVSNSGDGYLAWLLKNGAQNDAMTFGAVMPSSDQASNVALGMVCLTEAAGVGTVSGGCGFRVGTQAGTAFGFRSFADGHSETIAGAKQTTLYNGSGASAVPACNSGNKGFDAWVSDGRASPTFAATYAAADGSSNAKVGCDGTNWRYGY